MEGKPFNSPPPSNMSVDNDLVFADAANEQKQPKQQLIDSHEFLSNSLATGEESRLEKLTPMSISQS